MSKFISDFADDLEAMLSYRGALGYSRLTHESNLMSFDRYAAERYPEAAILSRELVTGWIGEKMEKSKAGITARATAIRLFGKYLSAVGKGAYILPDEYVTQQQGFTPYIFTDNELTRLFRAADSLPGNTADLLAPKIAPVMLRLIYTCGLRPNEGRELLRENIDFKTGEIFITKTKRQKERIVVMSDDMLCFMKKYDAIRDTFAAVSKYIFPRNDGQAYTTSQIERLFKKCWADANPFIAAEELPAVRVYDLRHRFASAALNKWLDEGRDLYNMLPYLRAYMGHDNMSETAYYIHILPENLIKSAGIDWSTFEALIPGCGKEESSWRQ